MNIKDVINNIGKYHYLIVINNMNKKISNDLLSINLIDKILK